MKVPGPAGEAFQGKTKNKKTKKQSPKRTLLFFMGQLDLLGLLVQLVRLGQLDQLHQLFLPYLVVRLDLLLRLFLPYLVDQ